MKIDLRIDQHIEDGTVRRKQVRGLRKEQVVEEQVVFREGLNH